MKIFSRISLYTVYFMLLLLYFVIFEIPIPFIPDKVVDIVYKLSPEHFPEGKKSIRIGSIAVTWNYDLNRPIIMIKNIIYRNVDSEIKLNKIGFYPNITQSIQEKKLFIEKIYVEGLSFVVLENKGQYNVFFKNKTTYKSLKPSSVNTKSKVTAKSFNDSIVTSEDYKNKRFYQVYLAMKDKISMLKSLDEVVVSSSSVIVVNENKQLLIFDIEGIFLKQQSNHFQLNLQSNVTFDNNINEVATINLNTTFDQNNFINTELSVNKLLLSKIKYYFPSHFDTAGLRALSINGFESNADVKLQYDLQQGIKNLNARLDIQEGSFSYKKIITKPVIITSISSALNYNSKQNTINISKFNIFFSDSNSIFSKYFGMNILLSKISSAFDFNLNDKKLSSKYINIETGKNTVTGFLEYFYVSNKRGWVFNAGAESTTLELNDIKDNWPTKILPEVRNWIVKNVHEGTMARTTISTTLLINNDKIEIRKLQGNTDLTHVQVTYLDGMPDAIGDEASVSYGLDDVTIHYKNAKTGNIISENGEIKFIDHNKFLDGYQGGIYLNLKTETDLAYGVEFIDNKPLGLATKYKLSPSNFSGHAKGFVELLYMFDKSQVKDININFEATDLVYKKVFKDIDITNGNVNLLINDYGLVTQGEAKYLDEDIDVKVSVSWEDPENIVSDYNVKTRNLPVKKIYTLDILDSKILDMLKGNVGIDIAYHKEKDVEKVFLITNLRQTEVSTEFFNYSKEQGDNLLIQGDLLFNEGNLYYINDLDIKSGSDLNILMDINISGDSVHNLVFDNFYIKDKADFKGTLGFDNKYTNIDLKGKVIDVTSLLEIRAKYLKEANKQATNKEDSSANTSKSSVKADSTGLGDYNYKVSLVFDKIISKNESIDDAYLKLFWSEGTLRSLNFGSNISSVQNSYMIFDENTNILALKLNDLGGMLRFFNLSSKLNGGDLEGKISFNRKLDKETNQSALFTKGDLVLNNFSAGVSFATSYISFEGKNLYFYITQFNLRGNMMGGDMSGYLDLDKRYIDISGKLIPIWSASNLISNAPIIKSLLRNKNNDKNILQINSRISGSLDDIKYSFFSSSNEDDKSELTFDNFEKSDKQETTQDNNIPNAQTVSPQAPVTTTQDNATANP